MDWLGRFIDMVLAFKNEREREGFKPLRWLAAAGGAAWTAYTFNLDEVSTTAMQLINQAERAVYGIQFSAALNAMLENLGYRIGRLFF